MRKDLLGAGVRYTRNPLGIIALFIFFIYATAGTVLGVGPGFSASDRTVMVWFLVSFPFAVLAVFATLVMFFHEHLYSPQDVGRKEFLEISKRKRAAAELTRKAIESRAGPKSEAETQAAQRAVLDVATPEAITAAGVARALWVDDNPTNNFYEREALRALGIDVDLALTTHEALDLVKRAPYDVIISDMKRDNEEDGGLAGYKLLDALRQKRVKTPFILYVASTTPEHQADAVKRGALGQTNRPEELIETVLAAIS